MLDNKDPGYKEIIDDFVLESMKLSNELDQIINKIDLDNTQINLMENFGQIIDRIMGASKSLDLKIISDYCELGKLIGYKCSQISKEHYSIIPFVIPILSDMIVLLKKMLTQLSSTGSINLQEINLKAFGTRLKWLSDKFKFINRSSCKDTNQIIGNNKNPMDQKSIDDLLSGLGI